MTRPDGRSVRPLATVAGSDRLGRGLRIGLALLLAAAPACGTKQTPTQVALPTPTLTPSPALTPVPPVSVCAAPETCPPLYVWSVGIHHWQDSNAKLVEGPAVGITGVFDSTPRFGASRRSCNQEDHRVCSSGCGAWRQCEDPRGARWFVDGPAHLINVQLPGEHCDGDHRCGFQARVGLDGPGEVEVTTCPPPDYTDGHGKTVEVVGSGCQTYVFQVPEP